MSPTLPNPHHPTSEELFAYRDGELTADRRVLIEAHVLACAQCRERIDAMSSAEADLRSRPDGVDEEYFERMTESVMARVGAAGGRSAAREPAEGAETAGTGARAPAPEPPADVPRVDRRRPDYAEVGEIEPKRRLRMPWFGVAGTAAAAVAVVVVAVALFQRQGDWMRAPRPAVVGEPQASAPAPAPESTLAREQASPAPQAKGGAGSKRDRSALKDKAFALKKAERTKQNVGAPAAGATTSARDEALSLRPMASREAPEAEEQKAALAPSAGRVAQVALPPAAPGDAYGNVLRAYRLPPVWNPGVSADALARAEKDLRYLYQMGRAGADSGRVRLYLAEAERARLADPSNTAAVESISHHYRRAISLAGSDAALAATARKRLAEFEQEMILRRETPR